MGIFEWVKSQTGVWGPALLDVYFQNSGWINTLLVAYGLLLLLSWQNLSRVSDSLVEQILEPAKAKRNASKRQKVVHLSDFHLSWENASRSSKFPFIAKQTGILIHRSTPENIRALITEHNLIHRCGSRLGEIGFRLEQEKQ